MYSIIHPLGGYCTCLDHRPPCWRFQKVQTYLQGYRWGDDQKRCPGSCCVGEPVMSVFWAWGRGTPFKCVLGLVNFSLTYVFKTHERDIHPKRFLTKAIVWCSNSAPNQSNLAAGDEVLLRSPRTNCYWAEPPHAPARSKLLMDSFRNSWGF